VEDHVTVSIGVPNAGGAEPTLSAYGRHYT